MVTDGFTFSTERHPKREDMDYLTDSLDMGNIAITGLADWGDTAAFIRDDSDQIMGGVRAQWWADAFEITYLWIREDLRGRGYGRRLMAMIEDEARALGCTQIRLDTFDFQAPDFYKKLGYEVFGQIDNFPAQHTKYYLRKRL
jgi:ribosomal protein S18 acetylase RimI-like enzyme